MREPCSGVRTQASTSPWGNAMWNDADKGEYAKVSWRADDLEHLTPDWSEDRRREFLDKYEYDIGDRMVERGWDVIEDLLREEGVNGD